MRSGNLQMALVGERGDAALESRAESRFDAWTDRVSDRFNPILIKECRQAIKSQQFLFTFCATLFAAWMWTLLGLSNWMGPTRNMTLGGHLLVGYVVILLVPLLVIVPYGAFRSLIAEREDGTYELSSITNLTPGQIVAGKFGSSALQTAMYLCALAPCLTLTYLLRGVDLPTIALAVAYPTAISALASIVALAAATVAKERPYQLLLSVLVLIALIGLLYLGYTATTNYTSWLRPRGDGLWSFNSMTLTFSVSFFVLFWLIAAAQLAPAGANRSTRVRWALLAQQLLLVAWFSVFMIRLIKDFGLPARGGTAIVDHYLMAAVSFCFAHMWIAGMFLAVEFGTLTPRTRRNLPQTSFRRALLTWFNPGSASGYMFALSTFGGVAVSAGVAAQLSHNSSQSAWKVSLFSITLFSTLVIYLGISRLIVTRLKLSFSSRWFTSLLIQVTLALLGLIVARWLGNQGSVISVFNVMSIVGQSSYVLTHEHRLLYLLAFIVFAANLRDIIAATQYERAALPERVAREEREQRLAQMALERRSPWSEVDSLR